MRSRGKLLPTPVAVDVSALLQRADIGVMLTPASGRRTGVVGGGSRFAVDTGCFRHPESFDLGAYLSYLEWLAPHAGRCLFATAPDTVADWPATWAKSESVLPRIRALGLCAALVAQDGLALGAVPWEAFDCLFVGGSTGFKLAETTYALVREATARGKWTHQGRCNSWQRLKAAHQGGYASADGTCLAWNPPQYAAEIAGWLDRLTAQPHLELW